MVRWALDYEQEARRIAERATLFMYDLVLQPDAASDDHKRLKEKWHNDIKVALDAYPQLLQWRST